MPATCQLCETNTHSDHDKEQFPKCERQFLTKNEAWSIIGDNRKSTYHVMRNPKENILIGADFSRKGTRDLIQRAEYIEISDPKGEARRMGHGIAVMFNGWHHWVETDEKALKAYEELYCG